MKNFKEYTSEEDRLEKVEKAAWKVTLVKERDERRSRQMRRPYSKVNDIATLRRVALFALGSGKAKLSKEEENLAKSVFRTRLAKYHQSLRGGKL
ncbi:MAG: hypothetical protein DRQ78_09890 [Epsilonproteobacteria bacterium]|nr:MAG: hypothetical protein DRQ78_09890 [Campylobacterota bacterium]